MHLCMLLCHIKIQYGTTCKVKFVTRPEKAGRIYTKHTCSYYGTYLLFCIATLYKICKFYWIPYGMLHTMIWWSFYYNTEWRQKEVTTFQSAKIRAHVDKNFGIFCQLILPPQRIPKTLKMVWWVFIPSKLNIYTINSE